MYPPSRAFYWHLNEMADVCMIVLLKIYMLSGKYASTSTKLLPNNAI